MSIESNEYSPTAPGGMSEPDVRANQERHTNFTAADVGQGFSSAPGSSFDFVNLTSRIGLTRIDAAVEPYLVEISKWINETLPNVTRFQLERLSNSYVYRFDGPDGVANFFNLTFIQTSDSISPRMVPASFRLEIVQEELRERFKSVQMRIVDARIVLAGYKPDMDKAYEMANTIVRAFQVTTIPELQNANIAVLKSNEFDADWRLSEARLLERALSPHGIAPRMDIGLTLKAKIKNNFGRAGRDLDTEYRPLGVIGGYTEIREREVFNDGTRQVLLYQPVFNITVCNSVIPVEGVFAILMAALAPTIYDSKFWVRQWQELQDGRPNPGLLEEDPDNRGRPIILKDLESLNEFVSTYFARPIIAFQFQDGRDSIPGVWRLASPNADNKNHLMDRLAKFFDTPSMDVSQTELSRIMELRYDGAYGEPNGTLHDSRDIDYLYIASKLGFGAIDAQWRRVLLSGSENQEERAKITQSVTNSFIPLALTTITVVNPDLIKWIIQKTSEQNLLITDPNGQQEARPIASVIAGFGQSQNLGSIIHHGTTNRGLGLTSIWGNYTR